MRRLSIVLGKFANQLAASLVIVSALSAQHWVCDTGMPTRESAGVVFDAVRNELLVFGGSMPAQFRGHSYGDTWGLGVSGWREVHTANAPPARALPAMAFDTVRGRAILFGGQTSAEYPYQVLSDTWEYDGLNWHEVLTSTSPVSPLAPSMTFDSVRQRVVLVGSTQTAPYSTETWEYDGVHWVQRTTVTTPNQVGALTFVPLRNRTVMVGTTGYAPVQGVEVWEFDGLDWALVVTPQQVPPRLVGSVAADAQGRVVLFGGSDNGAVFRDTWVYDGTTWLQVQTIHSPPPTGRGTLIAEPTTARVVMMADCGIWHFDGTDWTQTAEPVGLPPCTGSMLAFDSGRDRLVRLGGFDPNAGLSRAHWEWDGQHWRERQLALLPPTYPSVWRGAYDSRRQRIVLHGDESNRGHETWEFDGNSWASIATAHSPDYWVEGMAYDPALGQCIAYAGAAYSQYTWTGTWSYDGVDWVQLPTTQNPPYRTDPAMVYDSSCDGVVFYGGSDSSYPPTGNFVDTWEWRDGIWTNQNPQIRPPVALASAAYDVARGRTVVCANSSTTPAGLFEFDGSVWQALATSNTPSFASALAACNLPMSLVYDAVRQRIVTVAPWGDVWHFQPAPVAQWMSYGVGCGNGANLHPSANSTPTLGSIFQLEVAGLGAAPGAVYFAHGFDVAHLSGAGLPVSMGLLGLPNCLLWLSPVHGDLIVHGGHTAQDSIAIPNAVGLAGLHFATQAFVFDPTAPVAIGALTNAGIATIQ